MGGVDAFTGAPHVQGIYPTCVVVQVASPSKPICSYWDHRLPCLWTEGNGSACIVTV